MGLIGEFKDAGLFVGVLASSEELLNEALTSLTNTYGPLCERSTITPFTYTDYYNEEMGAQPYRCYLLFENVIDPSTLATIKIATNELEEHFAVDGKRRVNIDPGLLSLSNLVLATTKNRAHRIALWAGIYAELTLIYYNHSYQSLPWTYADYKSEEVVTLLNQWRSHLKRMGE